MFQKSATTINLRKRKQAWKPDFVRTLTADTEGPQESVTSYYHKLFRHETSTKCRRSTSKTQWVVKKYILLAITSTLCVGMADIIQQSRSELVTGSLRIQKVILMPITIALKNVYHGTHPARQIHLPVSYVPWLKLVSDRRYVKMAWVLGYLR